MHIKGGLNGQRGNPNDPNDEGVFISKINSGGAARRDGRLKVIKYALQIFAYLLHEKLRHEWEIPQFVHILYK